MALFLNDVKVRLDEPLNNLLRWFLFLKEVFLDLFSCQENINVVVALLFACQEFDKSSYCVVKTVRQE